MDFKIEGLDDVLATLAKAFPADPNTQAKVLGQAMKASANKTIVPTAKSNALIGDGSGALSESVGVRFQRKAFLRSKGVAAGVAILPVRRNLRAMALYINHYYTSRGKNAPAKMIASGIRHGHLVEFGTIHSESRPWLWPAAQAKSSAFVSDLANNVKKKIEQNVTLAKRRKARKK